MDVRLTEMPFELDGKTYMLRCNMNVLADVQEAYDGNFSAALRSTSPLRTVHQFLAAMLNDFADEMGWPERYTAKQLGRILPTDPTVMKDRNALVMDLVTKSITAPADAEEVNTEKN